MSTQPIGLDDALSRIAQIQSYQQQLLNPASAAGAGTTGASVVQAAGSGSGSSSSGSSTDFAALLSALQSEDAGDSASIDGGDDSGDGTDNSLLGASSGDTSLLSSLTGTGTSSALSSLTGAGTSSLLSDLTGDTSTTGSSSALTALASLAQSDPSLLSSLATSPATTDTGVGGASTGSDAPAAVQAMTDEANSLVGKPYVWGGGHSGWGEQTGYDCSGFVSAVLHAGGYLSTPQDTVSLANAAGIDNGPGQYVTIYDRTDAGTGNDHVIIDINGQFYESGGEAGSWGGGGGVQKIATPSAAYLATFNRTLHPDGL